MKEERLEHMHSDKTLELTRERSRRQILDQFNYARTCMLARELCYLIRMDRVAFQKEDVNNCCHLVSGLCKEAGCDEASALCANAAAVVLASEEKYLELCEQSCKRCSELRQPKKEQPDRSDKADRTTYVA